LIYTEVYGLRALNYSSVVLLYLLVEELRGALLLGPIETAN